MTIGEFSSRCGLSAKVLRDYADSGILVPSAVDPSSGYRYYDGRQLDDAAVIALLRRAGVGLADIKRFLDDRSIDALEGWERSLAAEVRARREALAEVRFRLGAGSTPTRGATTVEIENVSDLGELRRVFDVLGAELARPLDSADLRFRDLETHFPADRALMVTAMSDAQLVGGALGFRNDDGWVTLRIIAVIEAFRHRGIGRRLVERVEAEARRLHAEAVGLGTDEAVGFWFHLGYTPNLLFQWVYDANRYGEESSAILAGPFAGLPHWRSEFNGIPQLFVELDEPRLDLRENVRDTVSGCHVGFMMSKRFSDASRP